jgi:hypothetical protein
MKSRIGDEGRRHLFRPLLPFAVTAGRPPTVGRDHKTVGKIRGGLLQGGEIPKVGRTSAWRDGKMYTANLSWKPTPIRRRRSFILADPTSESRFDEANHGHLLEATTLEDRRSMDRISPRHLEHNTQPPKIERGTFHVIAIDER